MSSNDKDMPEILQTGEGGDEPTDNLEPELEGHPGNYSSGDEDDRRTPSEESDGVPDNGGVIDVPGDYLTPEQLRTELWSFGDNLRAYIDQRVAAAEEEILSDALTEDDLEGLYEAIDEVKDEVADIDEASTEELEELAEEYREVLSEYRDVLGELVDLVDERPEPLPEPDTPDTDYLTDLILEIADRYERIADNYNDFSNNLDELESEHRENMPDRDVSDIL